MSCFGAVSNSLCLHSAIGSVMIMPSMPQRPLCRLALLIVPLFCLAQTVSALECENSFFKNTPPKKIAESGLEGRCHSLDDGRQFFSLYHPESQSSVYTALRVGKHNAWGKETGEDDTESSFYIPAILKRDTNAAPSDSASPLQKLDSLTAELMGRRNVPRCSDAEGDLYVHSGVGRLRDSGEGVLWSAVCCAVPNGPGSFSMGVMQDQDDEDNLKILSIKELEELVGIEELFAGGCGDFQKPTDDGNNELVVNTDEEQENVETKNLEIAEDSKAKKQTIDSQNVDIDEDEAVEKNVNDVFNKRENIFNSGLEESANNTESLFFNVLSTSISLLFYPIISTLNKFPSQVGFVIQEDAAVLASLPVDSVRLVHNLGLGVVKTVQNVGGVGYQVSKHSVYLLYDFISTITNTLLNSCYEGLVGTGTLTCDILGLATDTLKTFLDFGTSVGGTACRKLGGFVGTVGYEMGEQSSFVGRGVGMLIWRGARGVSHLLNGVLSIVVGVVGNTVENVKEAFENE